MLLQEELTLQFKIKKRTQKNPTATIVAVGKRLFTRNNLNHSCFLESKKARTHIKKSKLAFCFCKDCLRPANGGIIIAKLVYKFFHGHCLRKRTGAFCGGFINLVQKVGNFLFNHIVTSCISCN